MSMTELDENQALAALSAGDGAAFRVLYDKYADRGLHYARSILQNDSDSEEAVQEAFCRLVKPVNAGKIDPALGGFSAVFFGTLRNLCIDMMRQRRHRSHLPLDAVAEPGIKPVAPGLEAGRIEEKVRSLLDKLPSHHADALKLKMKGGLSYDQIADVLGCTHAQVRTWIFRARRTLEESFQKEGLIRGRE
jgi:RNA polymerase sigma-70 factor (ECF subfamily)